jgi:hypothetical protein
MKLSSATCKYPPAEPGALGLGPLEAAVRVALLGQAPSRASEKMVFSVRAARRSRLSLHNASTVSCRAALSSLSAPRMTILSAAASGSVRCSALAFIPRRPHPDIPLLVVDGRQIQFAEKWAAAIRGSRRRPRCLSAGGLVDELQLVPAADGAKGSASDFALKPFPSGARSHFVELAAKDIQNTATRIAIALVATLIAVSPHNVLAAAMSEAGKRSERSRRSI